MDTQLAAQFQVIGEQLTDRGFRQTWVWRDRLGLAYFDKSPNEHLMKLTAGGGVALPHSPLDVSTFTALELRAAVEAAENWGTYVTVHAYTPMALQRAITAGVKCIEHSHLMGEATAQLMAENGIWLSIQPFLDDEDAILSPPNSPNRARQLEMVAGTDTAYFQETSAWMNASSISLAMASMSAQTA
jgi:imidazolonepropionase-like amidohydrolase